jgi:hypothetical protein
MRSSAGRPSTAKPASARSAASPARGVERQGVRRPAGKLPTAANGVLACPERCLEHQRCADALGDPAVWRQAERAEQDAVLPDGVAEPVAAAVHRVQDHPPPGIGSQQAAGQLRGTAGHHVPVAQNVYARETARVDDPFRRVDLIAQCPARAGGHGRSRTGGGHERIAEGRPDGNADALNLARPPQRECAGRDRQPGRGRAAAPTVCLCGPASLDVADQGAGGSGHRRRGRGAGAGDGCSVGRSGMA